MVKAVLFDVGNTLISYYSRSEFPAILRDSIVRCINYLKSKDDNIDEDIWERVQAHNHGSPGDEVFPMEDRLGDIFSVNDNATLNRLCELFMEPIIERSRLYDDVIPALRELKRRGFIIGVISNTPWGCPSRLWKGELERYGLLEYLDDCVFCVDVGWRKPDERIFKYALERLGVNAEECLFIGDDPRWDIRGPEALGMKTFLIDRTGKNYDAIQGLEDLIDEIDKRGWKTSLRK